MPTATVNDGVDRNRRLSTPNPDPTARTNENLIRELDLQAKIFEAKINEVNVVHLLKQQIIETRLDALDKATTLKQSEQDRLPTYIDGRIDALKEIQDEKFSSIEKQFKERDVRSDQTQKDSKVAVDAALSAAKEAVTEQNKASSLAIGKSEASTLKQIDQIGLLIQTGTKASDDKISDLKDRLTRLEGKEQGVDKSLNTQQLATVNTQANTNITVFILATVFAILFEAAGLIVAFVKH